MSKYAVYTGLVTNSDKTQVSLKEGELWPDDDVTVQEHPEFFRDTEPNSETAGAFPMEHQQRSTEGFDGGAVEAKRMEGEHPRGYPLPGEEEPTRANPLEQVAEAEKDEAAKPAKRAGSPRVERATRAPGEKR
jgi:hypothetical protein